VENGLFKRNGMMLEVGLGAGLWRLFVHICIVRTCCWERQKSWMDHTWRLALGFFLSGFDAALAGGWL
jgi:hypothetical protein